MLKVENIDVFNLDGAIRGMRNPMNSWSLSDSDYCEPYDEDCKDCDWIKFYGTKHCSFNYNVGPNDMKLMKKLYEAGPEHAKYLRQVFVCMDITAPLYWWKEADQYRINVTTNSTSTMHKLACWPITLKDFSFDLMVDDMGGEFIDDDFIEIVNRCELARKAYLETGNKDLWRKLIQMLPCGYNQKRTITMTYANVMNIINQRRGHKLVEWRQLCEILLNLPYVKEIRGE